MLLRAVPERAIGALLGGDEIGILLSTHLAGLEHPIDTKSRDFQRKISALRVDLRRAIRDDVDRRTGDRHRLNEIEATAECLCPSTFLSKGIFPALDAAFLETMEWNGSTVCFKEEHVQRYAELVSELDPTVLVAWIITDKKWTRTKLLETVGSLTTLYVRQQYFGRPLADNHTHLNGIVDDEVVLAELILLHYVPKCEKEPASDKVAVQKAASPPSPIDIRVRRVRRLLKALIGLWKDTNGDEARALAEHESQLANACVEDVTSIMEQAIVDWPTEEQGIVVVDDTLNNRWLLRQLASAVVDRKMHQAWTWLFILLWRSYRSIACTETTRTVILLFIAEVMAFRRQLIMHGNGLRRFTTGYNFAPLRSKATKRAGWRDLSYRDAVHRTFASKGDKAEIKISAGNFEDVTKVTADFARTANERLQFLSGDETGEGDAGISSLDHWHFCLHFNRSGSSQFARREALWKEADTLKKTLGSSNKWKFGFLMRASGAAASDSHHPAEFVRGLDVAGDETAWPIEVFAPMLRWARARERRKDLMEEINVPPKPLHLSIHAGEDYAHPLSGLRHVDETVVFCGMEKGDRLGHALALGIAPDDWLDRHGTVLMPVDEHVDNLVWAWHQAGELASKHGLELASRVQARLAKRIDRFVQHVSWGPDKPQPFKPACEALYEAWELRLNCPTLVLLSPNKEPVEHERLKVGAPNYQVLSNSVDYLDPSSGVGLYIMRAKREKDALKLSGKSIVMVRLTKTRHGHSSRAQRLLEEASVPDMSNQMHDHDDSEDLQLMLALQDACLERYANRGISIEANPSSNVYIGQIETHSDHPIFRWAPPDEADLADGARFNLFSLRKKQIAVSINTDDQGIIPTTLRMEYHLMHEAALERGYSEHLANRWIDQLQAIGSDHFHTAHWRKYED